MASSIAFLGFRRGGSSIAFELLQRAVRESGLNSEDLVAKFHSKGVFVSGIPTNDVRSSFEQNAMVGVFRSSPSVIPADIGARPILILRDPRDCFSSWVYAQHLHSTGPLAASINSRNIGELLTLQDDFDKDIHDLWHYTAERAGLIIRYEDIVYRPLQFLKEFSSFSGFSLSREAIDSTVAHAVFLQSITDEASHNRSGEPYQSLNGDPLILDALTRRFRPALEMMGYPLDKASIPIVHNTFDREELDSLKRYILRISAQNALRIQENSNLQTRLEKLESSFESDRAQRVEPRPTPLRRLIRRAKSATIPWLSTVLFLALSNTFFVLSAEHFV